MSKNGFPVEAGNRNEPGVEPKIHTLMRMAPVGVFIYFKSIFTVVKICGGERSRTDDPLRARQVL